MIGRSAQGNECAWCCAKQGVPTTPGVSHGICAACLAELKAQIAARRAKEAGR